MTTILYYQTTFIKTKREKLKCKYRIKYNVEINI